MRNIQEQVPWRDLVACTPIETLKELLLPLPWLILSLYGSARGWYALSVFAAFYFFLTSLRLSHNAFHYALGLPRGLTDAVMFLQSGLMLGSLHAVQHTHLLHHRACLTDEDVEGEVARQSALAALLKGPLFPLRIHYHALRFARGARRRWIQAELLLNGLVVAAVFWGSHSEALRWHVVLMLVGYSLSAFFAVWTVHRDSPEGGFPARTLRGRVKSVLFYNMFYHLEHHWFPAVPTCHLPELARRLDQHGVEGYEEVF